MKLRNIWHEVLTLFKPQGDPESVTVEPGQTVEVPGELAADQPHDDAIVVEHPDGERLAYPSSLWEPVDAAPSESVDSQPPEPDAAPAPSTPIVDAPTTKDEG